jgi:hypothetical protein
MMVYRCRCEEHNTSDLWFQHLKPGQLGMTCVTHGSDIVAMVPRPMEVVYGWQSLV